MTPPRTSPRARVAPPLTGPTERAIREDERQRVLDEADRTMLATLITIDRRQVQQGQQLLEMAMAANARHADTLARLDAIERRQAEILAVLRGEKPANGHAVDPMAATMAAEEPRDA